MCTPKLIGAGIACAAIAATMSGAAHADVKIASTVAISSTGGPNGTHQHSQNIVAYYKGDSLRIENSDGTAMVYDAAAGKLYRIDPSAQTYSVMPPPPKPRGNPPANNDTFSLTASGSTSTIAGESATGYTLNETARAMPPMHGGPGGHGGGPGGDQGGPPPRDQSAGGPPKATITGTIWLSDSVKVDAGAQDAINITLGHEGLRGPIGHPIAAKLLTLQEIPLSANISIAATAPPSGGTASTTTIKITATSVSTDTLDTSLFTVPSGYTEVQGGPPPGGGLGGPGGFGGPPQGGGPGGDGQGPPPPAQ